MTHSQPPWASKDLAELDALAVDHQGDWWNTFYANRTNPVPFFGPAPDECLATWVNEGVIQPGKALDLGCGNGRNAVFLAQAGFEVEGVDYSSTALEWAGQRAQESEVVLRLHHASVFDASITPATYHLVYDSGCFHHMAPHRRERYIALVAAALKRGGWFGMTCFRPEGGSGLSDDEVYDRKTLGGGLGYSDMQLRQLWSDAFEICELRQMQDCAEGSRVFGKSFLWVMLARRK